MLTADLVRVKRSGGTLAVVTLSSKTRPRALELAERYTGILEANLGATYAELKEAWAGVELSPREKKLGLGLQKLIEDRIDLGAESSVDPRALRSEVFLRASAARREAAHAFSREAVLRDALTSLAPDATASATEIEDALYTDLKSQHRVRHSPALDPNALIQSYDLAQYQAVLLRATKLRVRVESRNPIELRDLFRTLKFRRLLHTIRKDGAGFRIEIDGPFSLFEAVTKYGLQLALVFPRLVACDEVELEADLRWGKARTPLTFSYRGKRAAEPDAVPAPPSEVDDLCERFRALGSRWSVAPSDAVLDLPGVGMVIPDLSFTRGKQRIHFELLGYWSREAVWKRVELVEAGLPEPVLFAVSSRLRVSESVLEDGAHGALYVFKGTMNPTRVLEKLERLAAG